VFNKGVIIGVPMYFSGFFYTKPTLSWTLDSPKFQTPFSGQSLLLSITVLNDKHMQYYDKNIKSNCAAVHDLGITKFSSP